MATKKTRPAVSDVVRQETQSASAAPPDAPTEAAQPVPLKIPEAKPTAQPATSTANDDLDRQIAKLDRQLQTAKSRETELEQELKDARSQIKELTAANEKNLKLAAELAEAKKTIQQLIETNQKASAPAPTPTPAPKTTPALTVKERIAQPAPIHRYPIQPIKTAPSRSVPDVGWMD